MFPRLYRESLSDPGGRGGGGSVPDALVTEHVGGELGLGLGQAGAGGPVIAVDLKLSRVHITGKEAVASLKEWYHHVFGHFLSTHPFMGFVI